MKFTDKEILSIISSYIENIEKIGYQSGGSGNMGYVDYKIDKYEIKDLSGDNYEIKFDYKIFIETEFTYYPDNPPYEYSHCRTIIINSKKEIIGTQNE